MSGMSSRFLIYGLIDPRDGQLRYVGKSSSGLRRPRRHVRLLDEKSYKANWVRELVSEGLSPEIEVLEEHQTAVALPEAECYFIAYFRSIGCRLTNLTTGGDGAPGHKMSDTGRERLRLRHLGTVLSVDVREKISLAHKGKRLSEEHRRKIAVAGIGRLTSYLTRQKRRMAALGNQNRLGCVQSGEERRHHSEGAHKRPIVDDVGSTYASGREAAAALGVSPGRIVAAIKRGTRAGGRRLFYSEVSYAAVS